MLEYYQDPWSGAINGAGLSFTNRLHKSHFHGLQRYVRGLAPNDTYPYERAELDRAARVWASEVLEFCATYLSDAHYHDVSEAIISAIDALNLPRLRHVVECSLKAARTVQAAGSMPTDYAAGLLHHTHAAWRHSPERQDRFLEIIERQRTLSGAILVDGTYEDVREFAMRKADAFWRLRVQWERVASQGLHDRANELHRLAVTYMVGILPDWTPGQAMKDAIDFFARASCPKWWRRRANRTLDILQIELARQIGLVGLGRTEWSRYTPRAAYLPDFVMRRHKQKMATQKVWMAGTIIVPKGGGEARNLDEIAEAAIKGRAAELAIFVRAQARICQSRGWRGFLLTVTLPPSYHSMRTIKRGKKGGDGPGFSRPNPKFAGHTAVDGIEWKRARWKLFRSRMQKIVGKKGWEFSGSLEAHTDATPHWHSTLYFDPVHEQAVYRLVLDVFLFQQNRNERIDPHDLERGTMEHQIDLAPFNTPHGAEEYAVKQALYSLKSALDGEEANPESIYATKLGARSFDVSNQNKGLWRWLRRHPEPDDLPDGLRRAWHLAHGRSGGMDELPRLKMKRRFDGSVQDSQTPRRKFVEGSCDALDAVEFIENYAHLWRTAFGIDDFYSFEHKTLADYDHQFVVDEETGEVATQLTLRGFEQRQDDYYSDDAFAPYKKVERKLNAYGGKKTPTKPRFIFNKETGETAVNMYLRNWEVDEVASKALRKSLLKQRQDANSAGERYNTIAE